MTTGRVNGADVERVFREHYGRAVAILVRLTGSIELAEESVQDAFAAAVVRWPEGDPPPSPVGWIVATARNRARDRLRRESSREWRHEQAEALMRLAAEPVDDAAVIADDRLRLMFTCCHPALAPASRVALTLRLVGGLTTAEIARAFMVPETTLAQRLVRAKAKIRDAGIPYRLPAAEDLPDRLRSVLAVVYLVFNEGYAAAEGDQLSRKALCGDAIRLGRVLVEVSGGEPEVHGLLALMLFSHARRAARTDGAGRLVPLAEQDRSRWDRRLIFEAQAILRHCLRVNRPGPYQLQAAIQAVHSDAATPGDTDWPQIVTIYDHLMALAPGPVVALNRAVAMAERDGPEIALGLVDELPLDDYYLFHAVRADLLGRVGRPRDALVAYDRAIALCGNAVEQAHLLSRRRKVQARLDGL